MTTHVRVVRTTKARLAPTPQRVRVGCSYALTATQLRDFVRDGFLVLWPTVPGGEALHRHIWDEARQLHEKGEFGNNLLASCPSLDAVLDSPEIAGALQGLLGEDYALQAHRHCHATGPQRKGQQLHQDSFFGFEQFRHAVPTDIMVMYYPQAVSQLMGPTAVIPGSQYSRSGAGAETQVTTDRAGACLLMHYHLWHRATEQIGGSAVPMRYMFKFQFRRTRQVQATSQALTPACAGSNPFTGQDAVSAGMPTDHRLTCAAVWAILAGKPLPQEASAALSGQSHLLIGQSLVAACGARPMTEVVSALLSAPAAAGEKQSGVKVDVQSAYDPPGGRWASTGLEGTEDSRFEAAGTLQLCACPGSALASSALTADILQQLSSPHGWKDVPLQRADWRLEALSALSAVLSPDEAVRTLVPLLLPSHSARTQFHALCGLYSSGVRCSAPASPAWHAAASASLLDSRLLDCIGHWEVRCAALASQTDQQRELSPDWGGRYALAEALRCLCRFGSPASAQRAAELLGVTGRRELYTAPGWRQRFGCYVERRRRCPMTTARSPF